MFQKLIACLSSNSKKVLAALLDQDDPVSAQYLADLLDLSISQVRYSVKKIQACLIFNGIEIQQKPNEGILIVIGEKEKKELQAVIQNENMDFSMLTQSERVKLLVQILLTSGDSLALSDIREITNISYTSFYRDLEKVRSWLNSFSLTLSSRRNKPLHLEGDELKIRNAIQEILFQNLGQDFLIQACILPVDDIEFYDFDKSVFLYQIHDYIESLDLPACEMQIRELEDKYKSNLFDRVHIELTLYLGVMAARIRQGKTIQKRSPSSGNSSGIFHKDTAGIFKDLLSIEDDPELAGEKEYLDYLITQCFQHGVSNLRGQDLQKKQKGENNELARLIVKEIAKYLHAGLYEDRELINCIEWELSYSLRSQNFIDAVPEAPLKPNSVQSMTEQTLFKILSPILKSEGIVNTREIIRMISNHTLAALERVRSSSLQRRVLLVCGSGIATAFSLRSQLNTQLPEIDVVEMVSVFELAHNAGLVDDCDAIISTVPLGSITSIPQIHVNALLTEDDIENIKNTLGLDRYISLPAAVNSQFNLKEIVNRKAIKTKVAARQPAEVIDKVGGLLLEIGAIWPSYIKAMKNLYSLYGPYMVIAPNTALLHAGPEMGSKKLAISLITLKEPIAFGHKLFDPVMIAMAFSSPVNSVHTNALSDVFNFFAVKENREKIIQSGEVDDILAILNQSEIELVD